jgi:beta-lactamase superfamily II metal-dependent hydrolase
VQIKERGLDMSTAYAGYPSALIFENSDGKKPKKQLLWGDFVTLNDQPEQNGLRSVRSRGVNGWMKATDLVADKLLEVVFVDIGQGDGALVITPDDKHILVDAGQEDNLYRFLRWRYGRFANPFKFDAAVISHSDQDHYGGFKTIFTDPQLSFDTLYHNGIVERAGRDTLGPRSGGYLTDIISTRPEIEALLADPAVSDKKTYPTMLKGLLASGRVGDVRGVSSKDGHLPGFAPGDSDVTIELLGPVRDTAANGKPLLRWFENVGKTKNGHSVVLRLVYGEISVLLGGDLNTLSENHLLTNHTGYQSPPSEADRQPLLDGARKVFRSDVAKACHHGSADFTDLFIQAIDPLVTVISSGDNEPHAHPRADSLGAVGRWGRGARPLVFSTELARSTKDTITHPQVFRTALVAAQNALNLAPMGPARLRAQKKVDDLLAQIERSVAVYGAINLRSDGKRIVMAQKVESPSRVTGQWDIYAIEPDANGVLRYRSKHQE